MPSPCREGLSIPHCVSLSRQAMPQRHKECPMRQLASFALVMPIIALAVFWHARDDGRQRGGKPALLLSMDATELEQKNAVKVTELFQSRRPGPEASSTGSPA